MTERTKIKVPADVFHDIMAQIPPERRFADSRIIAQGTENLILDHFVLVYDD